MVIAQPEGGMEPDSIVGLHDLGEGVFSIGIESADGVNRGWKTLAGRLHRTLEMARALPSLKTLVLRGGPARFPGGGREDYNEMIAQGLHKAIASFPFPIIADLENGAEGAGFLLGALCDFMVCSETARYSYCDPGEGFYATAEEDALFRERFGHVLAADFLYNPEARTGKRLREIGWTCPILPSGEAGDFALALASSLANKSQPALRLLKGHLSRRMPSLCDTLVPVAAIGDGETAAEGKGPSSSLQESIGAPIPHLEISDRNGSTLIVNLRDDGRAGMGEILAQLAEMFRRLEGDAGYKSVLLRSGFPGFFPEADGGASGRVLSDFHRLALSCPVPIIAVSERDAVGLSWLMLQFCDAVIYNEQGCYGQSAFSGMDAEALTLTRLSHRFGDALGRELFLAGGVFSGLELQKRAGTSTIVPQDQALSAALCLADAWAVVPGEALRSWKKRWARVVAEDVRSLPAWPDPEAAGEPSPEPFPIALKSTVVSADIDPQGIVVVRMADKDAKNMFTEALIKGLHEAFTAIDALVAAKVVVLTGYDTYFASGGTKDGLQAIQQGKAKFTDNTVFRLPADCKLPVIAAMQGHAIGGGWSLGMMADFALFSSESKYLSPYMDFGFTPGAGASLVFPHKIGNDLARESLLAAREFGGDELKARGMAFAVLPRREVLPAAMDWAGRIAKVPRKSLLVAKRSWTAGMLARLEETYRLELAMHEKTFVGKAVHLDRINAGSENPGTDNIGRKSASVSEIRESIGNMLAEELHMEAKELDEEKNFIDLGLDSITGVTWMRKINGKYRTSIEATKVYSHPTLIQLSRYVLERIEALSPSPAAAAAQALPSPSLDRDLKEMLAGELQMRVEDIDEDRNFVDLGLDSITGVTWMRKINARFKTSIEATKVYAYPNLTALGRYVRQEAGKNGGGSGIPVSRPAPAAGAVQPRPAGTQLQPMSPQPRAAARRPSRKLTSFRSGQASGKTAARAIAGEAPFLQPIAVIGMAGQFPEAGDTEAFWANIAQGRNCIREIPKQRWDADAYYGGKHLQPGKSVSKWLGQLQEYDRFDPLFFNISPTEAISMDPQQRVFLQNCYHCIEDAGYDAKSLSGSKCGVFVGCGNGDYKLLSKDSRVSAHGFTGDEKSILGARISYFLNLRGACLSIDTACSSSLVALSTACDSLSLGGCDLALAGGVYVMVGPEMHIKTSQSGILSPTGKCAPFDQSADGTVPGEAVGVVLLKRLADAERDRDRILGVIQGWGSNQDGKTNGITAPNAESQARLQRDIYEKFRIDPGDIQLVEAHGTGTKLGDPIELEGLIGSFREHTRTPGGCALGSVKSNIGHCLTAAGIAGFIKLLLALKHKQLPPTINFGRLNEHIRLEGTPFYVNDALKAWDAPGAGPRRAAISSFGFSGTNAHLVVSEYAPHAVPAPVSALTQDGKFLVPLSAKTTEQLRQKARDLAAYLGKEPVSPALPDIAYTLQVGREGMEERAAFLAHSPERLADLLGKYADGAAGDDENVFSGSVRQRKGDLGVVGRDEDIRDAVLEKWIAQRKLHKIAGLWVMGLDLDWARFYGDAKPQRLSLPLYPFAKERYWIEAPEAGGAEASRSPSLLHPMVHANTSDFRQQCYTSRFHGAEPFLADHQLRLGGGPLRKVLPGVAYLEMVRAAIGSAAPERPEGSHLVFRNTAWIQPVLVDGETEVKLALFPEAGEDAGAGRIEFEISSLEGERKIVHCQGQAAYSRQAVPQRIDLKGLKGRMDRGRYGGADVYRAFRKMGFEYGPAHRGILSIRLGDRQLLARLELPAVAEDGRDAYGLHPSLLDSALQASIGFKEDLENPGRPSVPFALDSLRILSPCSKEMRAWVRHSAGSREHGNIEKLDIDLCDGDGNVCVQMQGFTSRIVEDSFSSRIVEENILPTGGECRDVFDEAYYRDLLAGIEDESITIDEASEIG